MKHHAKHAQFSGQLFMVGCGSIGQAMLPLLLRHLEIGPAQISIIAADDKGADIAREYDVDYTLCPLTRDNLPAVLGTRLQRGDFLLNLSVDVSSLALIALCHERGALYLDTCTEPWAGTYTDAALSASQRSNYALRETVLAFGRSHPGGPTAVLTHGANPGLASAFVKQALLKLAADSGLPQARPASQQDWARLALDLGIRVIHVAERDTQVTPQRKHKDEFVNTWSVDGFMAEGRQPAELGWGTHERHWPADAARHGYGSDAAVYLNRPGAATRVRSWTPLEGPYHGFLITHAEAISIADHLTLKDGAKVRYRPTVHYAYYPCDDAVLSLHEIAGRNWQLQTRQRIIRDEVAEGLDELGVLLMGNARGIYWYGSRLTIKQARRLLPHSNATSLQVVAGVLAGMVWALRHPQAGVVEPEDIDHELVLEIATPYLGELVGVYGDWSPLQERGRLFAEELDRDDPWQFTNFRVT
jgi:homospermidine synthase